jgi:hypothetical protein
VLLSKVRGVLGEEMFSTREEPRLILPPNAFVDIDGAFEALHRAENQQLEHQRRGVHDGPGDRWRVSALVMASSEVGV